LIALAGIGAALQKNRDRINEVIISHWAGGGIQQGGSTFVVGEIHIGSI
jgi:hypothetical protein